MKRAQTNMGVFAALSCVVMGACATTQDEAVDEGPIRAVIHDEAAVYDGYLFWHQSDEIRTDVDNVTLLADARGQVVHTWRAGLTGGGHTSYLLPDGGLLRPGQRDVEFSRAGPVVSTDTIQITDRDGEAVWEVSVRDLGDFYFHHDVEPMPNGNILASTYHALSADEARAIGWDAGDAERVWTDGVIEIRPDVEAGGAEIVWSWNLADHIIQDRFPDAPNYGAVAEHPGRIDPHFPKSYAPMNAVRQHVNSVAYNEELDQIVLSSFIYDEIWIIDHSTTTEEAAGSSGGRAGRGGELLYRYGNPEAYGMGGPDDRLFLKQHDANWIASGLPGAGHMLVHNNNTVLRPLRPGSEGMGAADLDGLEGVSQVYELRLPLQDDGTYARAEGEAFAAEHVWKWESPDYFADFQGGARRLPNGSTLMTDTTDYLVLEVGADGQVIAEYHGPTPVYKAFKYSRDEVRSLLDE